MSNQRKQRGAATGMSGRGLVILGAIVATILLTLIYISYNATNSVPLVGEYKIWVKTDQVKRVNKNAEVRVAGVRVGRVADVQAVPPAGPDGTASVKVLLALEEAIGQLSSDTKVLQRPISVLGASYIELVPGSSASTVPEGGTLEVDSGQEQTELTDLLQVFDPKTAASFQNLVAELGDGLADRGESLNQLIARAPGLFNDLGQLSKALTDPKSKLSRFVAQLAQTSTDLGSVSTQFAQGIDDAGTTMQAVANQREALGVAIDELPETLDVATKGFEAVTPAMAELAKTSKQLSTTAQMLPSSLSRLAEVVQLGSTNLRLGDQFGKNLEGTLAELSQQSKKASFDGAIRKMDELQGVSLPFVKSLRDAQVYCNSLTLFGQNFASAAPLPERGPVTANFAVTSLGAFGELFQNPKPSSNMHSNPLPNMDQNECESGNETWKWNEQALGNPAGNQSGLTRKTRHITIPDDPWPYAKKAGLFNIPESIK